MDDWCTQSIHTSVVLLGGSFEGCPSPLRGTGVWEAAVGTQCGNCNSQTQLFPALHHLLALFSNHIKWFSGKAYSQERDVVHWACAQNYDLLPPVNCVYGPKRMWWFGILRWEASKQWFKVIAQLTIAMHQHFQSQFLIRRMGTLTWRTHDKQTNAYFNLVQILVWFTGVSSDVLKTVVWSYAHTVYGISKHDLPKYTLYLVVFTMNTKMIEVSCFKPLWCV